VVLHHSPGTQGHRIVLGRGVEPTPTTIRATGPTYFCSPCARISRACAVRPSHVTRPPR